MDKNQDEIGNGPLIIVALIGIIEFYKINLEKLLAGITSFFIGVGKLILFIIGGIIAYFILKGVYLGILKIKQKIDSFKNWIKHVDQFLKRLQEANTSLNNKIYSLRNESELQQKIVDQNSFEIERIKKYLGLDQEDQVQSAAAEVLNGDS